mmetsp:Transcript_9139/g.20237  ORF Transcript_9139/g.20237 Transcript_9139/m.20237 type:complete len:328 (+) Transcript_9139:172-1155(+)|eukprot:CAMPEP_0206434668 /NCGR_PEP_ID=MMETSP0324_2-20121206/9329_1 /ASSEMBLY_ACC=CAM_ASM_000836 /TAXON_ID=2866 /ORGANISM="Crypthecodinium cohnii, Strain Seligo" /LENGTH=327 /DNA_ID=CAMNT_0053901295 /DNA_START=171 /DNA_END=1154 /DNA_ORIENTATION=+
MCKSILKLSVAVGIVPASVLLAVLLETPAVRNVDLETLKATPFTRQVPAPPSPSDPTGGDFGKAIPEGFGSGLMFDRMASYYDITNRFMALGLDQSWRRVLVNDCLAFEAGDQHIDLASGTADVALLAAASLKEKSGEAAANSIRGIDPSVEMLREGVVKVEAAKMGHIITLNKGDAQDMTWYTPLNSKGGLEETKPGVDTGSINKISMSFGVRNVPNRLKAFHEMKRVLKPSEKSRVCILEFSMPPKDTMLSMVANFFVAKVVPFIGSIVSLGGGTKEYEYLFKSIEKFPQPMEFAAQMLEGGLQVQKITSFCYGAVNLYQAVPMP